MDKNRVGGGGVLGEPPKRGEAQCWTEGGYVNAAVAQQRPATLPGETWSGPERQAEPTGDAHSLFLLPSGEG